MSRHPVVDGATQLLGIVGHPIAQVRAPEVRTGLFREHGTNMLCIPFHVPPEGLATFYAGARTMKNLVGMIVTIPHKLVSTGLVDELTERAQIVRSVNFIAVGDDGRWIGDVTDGVGFVENLKTNGADPKGKRALLIGTGGSAPQLPSRLQMAVCRTLWSTTRTPREAPILLRDLPKLAVPSA